MPIASPRPAVAAALQPAPAEALRCARCEHEVTSAAERVERGGAHVHDRINPGGWVWRFGCFARAPGCREEGSATEAFTWFPGYAWRLARCAACGEHLGWRWDGPDAFYGLILERLR